MTDIMGQGTALDHVSVADGMVGRNIDEYGELFDVADSVRDEEGVTKYHFALEGVSQNAEGWGTLIVSVDDNCITETYILYPEW